MSENDYYIRQKDKLSKSIEKFLKPITPELIDMFGNKEASAVQLKVKNEYDKLIPQFPYIGGDDNKLTSNLVQASWGLALYRVLKEYDIELYDIGKLIYLSLTRHFNKLPRFIRKIMGRRMFSKSKVIKMKRRAFLSREKKYPYDWVWEVNDGDGINYGLAIDYTECGIVKFFHDQDADELVPYLCNLDYVIFKAFGIELHRTKTLGCGCDCCNFRFIKNGTPREPWPPFFVDTAENVSANKTNQTN
ncbi:L-2-amino-thiazoline-4-carboxylic acid hydrolase [Vallitalea guaymasensis]|uniref:L-2-amino-thiazoline-4-carboxylic acid hydrolase n=1 Tax=Vallitalea guaymasensis TaxID=1185412 RepID=UPI000DE57506|nr:L-2-amino-thiazoline-4-carboxylic acid hydrolase [Vallitalea guaymasensis]